MTTSIVWPATLPCFLFSPYNVAPRPAAFEMNLGMVTRRAMVYTENNELFSVEMILSSTGEQALRAFFKTTTAMGTQSFLVDLWREGEQQNLEVNFYGPPPSFAPVAPGYIRATFTLLAKANVEIPEPDYDAIVLARSPAGYWRLDETSGTVFDDLSGNGRDLNYTGSLLTYGNPTLNLDGGTSLGRTNGAVNWSLAVDVTSLVDINPSEDELVPITVGMWFKHYNTDPTDLKTYFHIGGPGGGGQFYKLWAYRNAGGFLEYGYHDLGVGFVTKTSTIAIPLDTACWLEVATDYGGGQFRARLNGDPFVYTSWGVNIPDGIDPGRGDSLFSVGRRPFGNDGDAINGEFSHVEFYTDVVDLGMWDDWHL